MMWIAFEAHGKRAAWLKAAENCGAPGGPSASANPIAPTEENLMAGMKIVQGDWRGLPWAIRAMPRARNRKLSLIQVLRCLLCILAQAVYQLFWIIKGGVRYRGMFKWDGEFARRVGKDISDEKIWTAVTFLTHLDSLLRRSPRNGIRRVKIKQKRPASEGRRYKPRKSGEVSAPVHDFGGRNSCLGWRRLNGRGVRRLKRKKSGSKDRHTTERKRRLPDGSQEARGRRDKSGRLDGWVGLELRK